MRSGAEAQGEWVPLPDRDVAIAAIDQLAALVHEADVDDGRYDAPEAGPLFDGVQEFFHRQLILDREPA